MTVNHYDIVLFYINIISSIRGCLSMCGVHRGDHAHESYKVARRGKPAEVADQPVPEARASELKPLG